MLAPSGESLSWRRSGPRNVYRILIKTPTGEQVTTVSDATTYTPQPMPGSTVSYRVKTALSPTAWSNRVAITYPRVKKEKPHPPEPTGPPPPESPSPPPPESPTPSPTEAPAPPPAETPAPPPSPGPRTSEAGAGTIKYRLDAATYFDSFTTEAYAPWVKSHVSVIKGYPPFSDKFVAMYGLPVVGYHDPATEGQAPLGPTGIEAYVTKVKRDMSHGYAGVHIDDANWSPGFTPSPGPNAALANLIEAIRAAEPSAVIEINSQYHDIWPQMKAHNPDVERALRDVNVVTKEFGVGPTAGINTGRDYGEFMQYVKTLHEKGIHTVLTGDYGPGGNTPTVMEYNLATYFLVNDGGDFVNGLNQTPTNWWPGFDVKLGEPQTSAERSASGVWTRTFSGGRVYTVEPGAATQTIKLGKPMHSPNLGTVESVTLSASHGVVLTG